ncbi:MAG: glycoside hydrolase family 2 TIM barrel-domain containing protein [Bryobacteraceae bacterium]
MERRAFLSVAAAPLAWAAGAMPEPRRQEPFDFDWKFSLGDVAGAERPTFDDSNWRTLDLPHDWSIEGVFDPKAPAGRSGAFLPGGAGWYRKRFRLAAGDRGRKVFLLFDGVYHNSDVWVNGVHLGHRPYGFIGFEYELTPHLDFGRENVVAVRADNSDQPNCRWYTGSGIYRHVWLTVTGPVYVPLWGACVTTNGHTAKVRTRVVNAGAAGAAVEIETRVRDAVRVSQRRIPPGNSAEVTEDLQVPQPNLWSPENPALYEAQITLRANGRVTDRYAIPFGFREARFDPARGFLLNGEPVKLKGVCLHHDAGCLGAAAPERALERRLEALKSLGCNAIRTSHNPPAPELLDLCDRMGFLVIDEAFDKWGGRTNPGFDGWWERDLRAMLERDRNHPSVILWSVGNETGAPGSPEVNGKLARLVEFVHKEEPTRPVTCALIPPSRGNAEEKARAAAASGKLMDVVSVNYQEQWYEELHRLLPGTVILGSECYAYFRGDADTHQAYLPQNPWYDAARHPWVAGQFLWAGIEYLGESMGWPGKGWPNALIDTCGFPKPGSWFHRSVWRKEPLVRIAVLHDGLDIDPGKPHWGWPKMAEHWNFEPYANQVLRLQTVTNCETVELIVNGKSMGERRAAGCPNSTVTWFAPYQPGRVEAIARNRGETVARHELRTAGEPARIQLVPDRVRLTRRGDLSHIEVRLVDTEGITAPHADRPLTFSVEGAARLAGVDNGDLRGNQPYKGNTRSTYFGRALAVVQSTGAGAVKVTAAAPGLPPATLELHAAV